MFKKIAKKCLVCLIPFFFAACSTVPYTGRSRILFTDEFEEATMGAQAWHEVLNKEKPSRDQRLNAVVTRVGKAIASVANQPTFQWEFRTFDSPQANAFCLPGGKVAVYSGIFRYIDNEAELAAVMGHEIGHAIARHGGERISQGMLQEAGKAIVATAVEDPGEREIALLIYGGATQLGAILPYSRTHEYEADYIGILLMAKAGYDPRYAIRFWEKFSKAGSSNAVGEWFSTHPIGPHRVEKLKEALPLALKYYKESKYKRGAGATIHFNKPRTAR